MDTNLSSKIWITSDFHFGHNKDFIYKPRGFLSVEEMNKTLLNNYNALVRPQDDVYILGDLLLGGSEFFEEGIKILNQLNGKIHLVRGNHDTDKRWFAYQEICTWDLWEASNAIYLDYKGYHFYLSHYPTITSNFDYDRPLKQRLLNLCGHTHTCSEWHDIDKGFIYHCEVDAHDNRPVLLDDICRSFGSI